MKHNKLLFILSMIVLLAQLFLISSCGGHPIREISFKRYYTGEIKTEEISKVKVRILSYRDKYQVHSKANAYILESTIYFEEKYIKNENNDFTIELTDEQVSLLIDVFGESEILTRNGEKRVPIHPTHVMIITTKNGKEKLLDFGSDLASTPTEMNYIYKMVPQITGFDLFSGEELNPNIEVNYYISYSKEVNGRWTTLPARRSSFLLNYSYGCFSNLNRDLFLESLSIQEIISQISPDERRVGNEGIMIFMKYANPSIFVVSQYSIEKNFENNIYTSFKPKEYVDKPPYESQTIIKIPNLIPDKYYLVRIEDEDGNFYECMFNTIGLNEEYIIP